MQKYKLHITQRTILKIYVLIYHDYQSTKNYHKDNKSDIMHNYLSKILHESINIILQIWDIIYMKKHVNNKWILIEYKYIMVNSSVFYQRTKEDLFFNSTGPKPPSSGLDKSCKWKLYLDLVKPHKKKSSILLYLFCFNSWGQPERN